MKFTASDKMQSRVFFITIETWYKHVFTGKKLLYSIFQKSHTNNLVGKLHLLNMALYLLDIVTISYNRQRKKLGDITIYNLDQTVSIFNLFKHNTGYACLATCWIRQLTRWITHINGRGWDYYLASRCRGLQQALSSSLHNDTINQNHPGPCHHVDRWLLSH